MIIWCTCTSVHLLLLNFVLHWFVNFLLLYLHCYSAWSELKIYIIILYVTLKLKIINLIIWDKETNSECSVWSLPRVPVTVLVAVSSSVFVVLLVALLVLVFWLFGIQQVKIWLSLRTSWPQTGLDAQVTFSYLHVVRLLFNLVFWSCFCY